MFVVQNKNPFLTNNENHNLDTRQRNNLYLPQENLTIYQKGAYYSGIQIFNNLPLEIKNVAGNQNKFKIALKKLLHTHFTQLKSTLVNCELRTVSQDLWSSGQSFWLQIQRSRVRSPAPPDFLSSSGSGTGSTQPREVN